MGWNINVFPLNLDQLNELNYSPISERLYGSEPCANKVAGNRCTYCVMYGSGTAQLVTGICKDPTGSIMDTYKSRYCAQK